MKPSFSVNNSVLERVVDIVTTPNLDYKALVLQFAKMYPEIFVEAFDAKPVTSWAINVVNAIVDDKLVDAVKLLRNETMRPLKEALDVCVAVQYYLFGFGKVKEPTRDRPYLKGDDDRTYDQLVMAARHMYNL